jgi:serine/threonine protein kinase
MIDRRRFLSQSDKDSALREIAMLSSLNDYASPHVASMVQVLEDSNHFYIISDIVDGGNLLTLLNQQQEQHHPLSEQQVKDLARSLLLGVQALHALNICHHDLQPENILLLDDKRVQICDFGSAVYVDGDFCCKGRYGHMQYAAPEVQRGKTHGRSSDLWSVGVILYHCLCGHLPFEDPSKRLLKEKIAKAEYDFSQREWDFVSRPAKQLISNLLHADPQVRVTASEALKHTWLVSTSLPLLVSKRRRRETMMQRIWGKLTRKGSRNRNQTEDATTTACTASPTPSLKSRPDASSLTSEESLKRKRSLQGNRTM